MYEGETTTANTEIAITGKAEGQTAVTIGDVTYYIFVENDVKEVTLKIGETYNVPGKIVKESGDVSSITKEERSDMPPYKAITKVEEGTYLFGSNTHIMLNSASTVAGDPKGLGMSSANFNTGEYKDSMWTLKKSGNAGCEWKICKHFRTECRADRYAAGAYNWRQQTWWICSVKWF